jgi:ribonuclease D
MLEQLNRLTENAKNNTIQELEDRIVLLEIENAKLKEQIMEHVEVSILKHIEDVSEQIIESKIIESGIENAEEMDQVCRNVIAEIVNTLPVSVPEIEKIDAVYKNESMDGSLTITYYAGDKMINKPYIYEKYQYNENRDREDSIFQTAEAEVKKMYKKDFIQTYNVVNRFDMKVILKNGNKPQEYKTKTPYETNLMLALDDLLIPKSLDQILLEQLPKPESPKSLILPEQLPKPESPPRERKRVRIIHVD